MYEISTSPYLQVVGTCSLSRAPTLAIPTKVETTKVAMPTHGTRTSLMGSWALIRLEDTSVFNDAAANGAVMDFKRYKHEGKQ